MKKYYLSILLVLTIIVIPMVATASDISSAKWYGMITISNNNSAETNVATVFTLNTTAMADLGYMNTSGNNTAIRASAGADVPYMPGYDGNVWGLFVPTIGANTYLTDTLYTGGTDNMDADIRYFPGTTGMIVSDDSTIEPSGNFSIEYKGFVNTAASENIVDKSKAFGIYSNGAGTINATMSETPVKGYSQGEHGSDSTDKVINMPTGIQAGELLLCIFTVDSNPTCSDASAQWTLMGQTSNGVVVTQAIFYKTAAGGDTLTVHLTSAQQASWVVYRIDASAGVPTGTAATGSSATADPPSHNTGAADSYFWIATAGLDGIGSVTAAPSNYSDLIFQVGGANSAGTGTASRLRYATTEDPGTFTNTAGSWVSYTLSVPYSVIELTATGIATGEHTIEVTGDGTDLDLYIDSVLEDTAALGGATVSNNTANWTIGSANITPYIEYFTINVGGIERCDVRWEYGTTFTDLSGNGNDATPSFITSSSDPHVSAMLSSFLPVEEADAPDYTLTDPPDFITSTPGMSGNFTASTLNITAPGWPVITAVAIAGSVPERLAATIMATLGLLMLSFSLSYMFRSVANNNILLKATIIFAAMCILAAIGFYDTWQLYFFVILALGIMWMSRQREAF